MQYLKDKGFILKRINFGDSDRYLTILSENNGKIEVVAKGVRKLTSRRASAVEPLNLIEFATVKSTKNMILTEVKLVNSCDHLKTTLENIKKVYLMCELLDSVLPSGQAHRDVFDLVVAASERMLEDKKNMAYFQVKLLSLLGFWDNQSSFKNERHVESYIEQIIERRLKTSQIFLTLEDSGY